MFPVGESERTRCTNRINSPSKGGSQILGLVSSVEVLEITVARDIWCDSSASPVVPPWLEVFQA